MSASIFAEHVFCVGPTEQLWTSWAHLLFKVLLLWQPTAVWQRWWPCLERHASKHPGQVTPPPPPIRTRCRHLRMMWTNVSFMFFQVWLLTAMSGGARAVASTHTSAGMTAITSLLTQRSWATTDSRSCLRSFSSCLYSPSSGQRHIFYLI